MSYESTLAYIHSENWQKHKNGLERIRALLGRMGNPQKKLKFVHVAGTNGKGSTAAMIASVFRSAGYRTGLFTSPYLIRFNERMQVNGEQIPDAVLEEITDGLRPIVDSMEEHPSEFELITAIGMEWFLREKCDIVVLEVGLGGEYDSTNVIDVPDCAVITAIGLDHTAMLGNTISEIASAKAGIIKLGGNVVTWSGAEEADAVFRHTAVEKGASLYQTDFDGLTVHDSGPEGSVFSFEGYHGLRIPLAGSFQPKNAAVAITALKVLREKGWIISENDIREGLANVCWPGRFEVLRKEPYVILDGAHNPHGIRAVTESLSRYFGDEKLVFVIGVMQDKAVDEMLGLLTEKASHFYTVNPDYYRAMPAAELAQRITALGGKADACADTDEALRRAVRLAGKKGVVCALGSLYISADIRKSAGKLSKELVTE